jgi:hypothetical protein
MKEVLLVLGGLCCGVIATIVISWAWIGRNWMP